MEISTRKKVLVYDGTCATCRVMKGVADTAVSNYEFVDASSDAGKKLVTEKDLDVERSAYLIDGEKVLSHSNMALEVLADVRFIGPLLAGAARIIPSYRRETMYAWLVRHRIR